MKEFWEGREEMSESTRPLRWVGIVGFGGGRLSGRWFARAGRYVEDIWVDLTDWELLTDLEPTHLARATQAHKHTQSCCKSTVIIIGLPTAS